MNCICKCWFWRVAANISAAVEPVAGTADGGIDKSGAEVPALVAIKLLKPLGNPAPNGIKFFDAAELLDLAKDHVWLVKVTNVGAGQRPDMAGQNDECA